MFSSLQSFLWYYVIFIPIIIMTNTSFCHAKFVYNPSWPFLARYVYIAAFLIATVCGYYVGIAHESFFTYVVLHGYFQMKVLVDYLRVEFLQFKGMPLERKFFSEDYQLRTKEILVKCIEHYQILTR